MIKAVIFDFNGVIYGDGYDSRLLNYIKELRQNYKLGIISNFNDAGYERYVVPIKNYFDDIVVSAHVGLAKPHPDIYLLAAKRLHVEPGECVYIDDEEYRVEGAQHAGMRAICYEDFKQMRNELEKLLSSVTDD